MFEFFKIIALLHITLTRYELDIKVMLSLFSFIYRDCRYFISVLYYMAM